MQFGLAKCVCYICTKRSVSRISVQTVVRSSAAASTATVSSKKYDQYILYRPKYHLAVRAICIVTKCSIEPCIWHVSYKSHACTTIPQWVIGVKNWTNNCGSKICKT